MPHLIYLAIGFPPAAKSSTYRMRATANFFAELGWDVTVVNLYEEAWLRESGIDRSLLDDVDASIEIVEIPYGRTDLEPDIRHYSRLRARHPQEWLKHERQREWEIFPEPVYGGLRQPLEDVTADIHRRKPADLLIASPAPNAMLAAAWKLWQESRVPYVVDFRDAWSLNLLKSVEAFPKDSEPGRWEERAVTNAVRLWTVNPQIQRWYQERYPEHADRVRTVRNGFDPLPLPSPAPTAHRDRHDGLRIGYLGTSSFPTGVTKALLEGWYAARMIDSVLAKSELVFRGHFGISTTRGLHPNLRMILEYEHANVSYGGPVPKARVGEVYAGWDALLFVQPGGRYVTSGKVYEYMATGLPIMSVHARDHAANDVLADYPLWIPPPETWSPELALVSFVKLAQLATTTDKDRERARRAAERFNRRNVMIEAVREIATLTGGISEPSARRVDPGRSGPLRTAFEPTPRTRRERRSAPNVLLIATELPLGSTIDGVAAELRAHGATVWLATYAETDQLGELVHVDEVHRVRTDLSTFADKPVRRYTPIWLWVLGRNRVVRRRLRRADRVEKTWLTAQNDPWLRHRAREADVFVAIDEPAVYTVWELAHLHPSALAVRGLYEALETVQRRDDTTQDPIGLASDDTV